MKDENGQKQTTNRVVFILHPSSFILRSTSFILTAALLSGCGTAPKREAPSVKAPSSAPASKGGYYLDDGPGDNAPANLDSVSDAVPRAEPLHRGAMRPYTVMGRTYVPMTAVAPYRARGVASWYGRRYHGKQTSSGEGYDMYGMTAAHTTLPIPSYARVTHVGTGRTVIVRINDRGPFIDSRLIDLSYTAAYKLGVLAGGSAMVEVEIIIPGAAPSATVAQPVITAPPASTEPPVVVTAAPPPDAAFERQIPVAADGSGIYLQLAAFGARENADAYAGHLRGQLAWLSAQLQVYTRDGLFRIHAGPFANHNEARQAADRISQSMGIKPMTLVK